MPLELLLLLAVALVTLKVGLIFHRRVRQMEADDLMAVADTLPTFTDPTAACTFSTFSDDEVEALRALFLADQQATKEATS